MTLRCCYCAVATVQVEGQPVQRPTVTAYLDSAYKHAYGEPFRESRQQEEPAAQKPKKGRQQQNQQQAPAPPAAAGDLLQQAPAQAAPGVSTFAAMTHLLLFADAVGSTAPLMHACAAGIDKLCLHVQLPTGRKLDLSIRTPYFWDPESSFSLGMVTEQQQGLLVATFSAADFASVKAALVQQVQAQTEALLYTAYNLQLSEVAEAVQDFIRMQTRFPESVLRDAMRPVLSPRVMDAAAGYRSLQEMLLLNHLITQPCSFKRGTSRVPNAFVPVNLSTEQQQPTKFTAEMVVDAFGSSKGEQVPVEVGVVDNVIKIGIHTHCVHHVLGPMVCTEEAKQAVLGPPAPAAE